MEAAGLAVGTLALVGVFEDCVTLLSQIGAAKSMEKDYKLLTTRLDFQRTLLLQWAERLKLYDVTNYDKRLDDPALGRLIHQGLDCIVQLVQDGHVLQQRYGVRPADVQEVTESSTAVSGRLMSRFRNKSLSLRFRQEPSVSRSDQTGLSHQPLSDGHKTKRPRRDSDLPRFDKTSLNKRTRRHSQVTQPGGSDRFSKDNRTCNPSSFDKIKWVIKDKEQFDSLVRKLSDLITDIDKVVPPRRGDLPNHSILENEIQGLKNARELRFIMHSFAVDSSRFAGVTRQTIDPECTQLILDRLWFRLIDDRRNNIAKAHSNTFEWAISPPVSGVVWDDLGNWLRSGRDIYWINGKPGSGKSTLMKFLYNHPKVMSLLHEWAGGRMLTVASFFLWNIGSAVQSSQDGLARGLLYHVLKQNPLLTPMLLPHMWQEAQSGVTDLKLPSSAEVKIAFEKLGAVATDGAFAFFIDGLDEFTGNLGDGISFVKSLATSANIKLLVSSRPIDTCVTAFSSAPKLKLQDLTKEDIEHYINDKIHSHPYAAESNYLSVAALQRLIDDIKNKAQGVFLWVVLACRTLLDGFDAADNAHELLRRVDELPPELEDLFRHILNSLDPRVLQQAAKFLRVCYVRRSLGIEEESSAIALAWAHEQDMQIDALEAFCPCDIVARQQKCAILEGRLRSRCRGLLEIHDGFISNEPTVDFMHRTVFEFLDSPDVWSMDCLQIDDARFDAVTILAYMRCYESYIRQEVGRQYIGRTWEVHDYMHCSIPHIRPKMSNIPRILRRLAFVVMQPLDDEHPVLEWSHPHLTLEDAAFVLAVELDMVEFVQNFDMYGFNTRQEQHRQNGQPTFNLLYHALERPSTFDEEGDLDYFFISSAVMIEHLLRSESDPNESITSLQEDTTTPWESWLSSVRGVYYDDLHEEDPKHYLGVAEIAVIMIRNGAKTSDHAKVAYLAKKCYRYRWDVEVQDQERLRELCNEIRQSVPADHQDDLSSVYTTDDEDDSSATTSDDDDST